MTTVYDGAIEKACSRYLPDVDWRLVKAQLLAESDLDPTAVSPVGARGIAQFMPATWRDVATALKFPTQHATAHDPIFAIQGCCYYMATILNIWTAPRPDSDRYCLALASYNAGIGNLLFAQVKSGGKPSYSEIVSSLHLVTGSHAVETRAYVRRTLRLYCAEITDLRD